MGCLVHIGEYINLSEVPPSRIKGKPSNKMGHLQSSQKSFTFSKFSFLGGLPPVFYLLQPKSNLVTLLHLLQKMNIVAKIHSFIFLVGVFIRISNNNGKYVFNF